jgi:hypothetical protein
MASTPVPGVNGTTMVMGRAGQLCAMTGKPHNNKAINTDSAAAGRKWNFRGCIAFCSVNLRHHYCPIRLFFPHVQRVPAHG